MVGAQARTASEAERALVSSMMARAGECVGKTEKTTYLA